MQDPIVAKEKKLKTVFWIIALEMAILKWFLAKHSQETLGIKIHCDKNQFSQIKDIFKIKIFNLKKII